MVTIQRIAPALLCVALLTNGFCFRANAAASQVNFKFVDPNQTSTAPSASGGTTTGTNNSGGAQNVTEDTSGGGNTSADSSAGTAASSADTATETDASAPTPSAPASGEASSGKSDTSAGKSDTQVSGKEENSNDTVGTKDGGMQSGKLGVPDQDSQTQTSASDTAKPDTAVKTEESEGGRVLQGYVRVVPSGTKVPIIMDTAVDSDTSQEGDEFSARTSEDLDIDGSTVVPAGSTIRGRVAQLNLPRRMDRSGSVALKFDTITTPDNRQIPLVANLVAHGGVVHAKRGVKDIAIDTSAVAVPTLAGLGIGLIAAKASSSSSIGAGGGALIGAGIGVAVGVAILLAKKGKKVDVRPGDELKIELAEDLRMPM